MTLVNSDKIPLGFLAPNFELQGEDGKIYKLADSKDKPGLLVIFTCNHCPYAQAAWPLIVDLYQKYKDQVDFVAINSNDSEQIPDDSVQKMSDLVIEYQVRFPYLVDIEQKVARAYQATCTPDIFLFKNLGEGQFELQYHGRINDNWQHPELVTENNLDQAIHNVINDLDPILNQHPSMGCSIKWKKMDIQPGS